MCRFHIFIIYVRGVRFLMVFMTAPGVFAQMIVAESGWRLKPRLKATAVATRPACAGPHSSLLDPRRRVLWAERPLRREFIRQPLVHSTSLVWRGLPLAPDFPAPSLAALLTPSLVDSSPSSEKSRMWLLV